jgi:hypothetical protein
VLSLMAAAGGFARPRAGLNHVLAYGQSLSTGWEGWPALSTAPISGALMLGDSVRPASEFRPDWDCVGPARLRPLAATVQNFTTGAVLSSGEIAALPRGAPNLGETVLEGAIAEFIARRGEDADQYLLASACGVGGRSLEELSRGASPELFNRLRGCVRSARDAAASWAMGYGLVALLFLQGENNSWGMGGTADREGYKALLRRFHADVATDIAASAAGQALAPAMFLYQTGGVYASADNAVAQAQLEVGLELAGCFLAAPSYSVTDKGGHLDANGYRWLGAQFGKAMHRVLCQGEAWRPLHPVSASIEGDVVHARYHVPIPPLAWGRPFVGHARVDVPQRGFTLHDENGAIPLRRVEIEPPHGVRITPARPPKTGATLRYADASVGGVGCLHDSDPSLAVTCYQPEQARDFEPDIAAPDIAELAGRPYPLQNWCVAFSIPVLPG